MYKQNCSMRLKEASFYFTFFLKYILNYINKYMIHICLYRYINTLINVFVVNINTTVRGHESPYLLLC